MKRTRLTLLAALLAGTGGLLFPAVRQVRVTAERAAIYAEPSRTSTRIDIVRKGDLLNLFQQQKVKNVWYYVSYISPQYRGRMSGFILDSAAEPVTEGEPTTEKPVPPPPKTGAGAKVKEPSPEQAKPIVEVPVVPEKVEPKPAPKPEMPKEKPKVAVYSESTGITPLPRAKRLSLPRRTDSFQDMPWVILRPPVPEPAAPIVVEAPAVPEKVEPKPAPKPEIAKEKPKAVEYREVAGFTPAPRAKRISLPRRSVSVQDLPWVILQPPAPKTEKPQAPVAASAPAVASKPAKVKAEPKIAPSTPPAARETRAEKKAAAEPAKAKPVEQGPAAPQIKPPRPVRTPGAARGAARLGIGLGFGPSFGGAGGSLQLQLSRSFALHAGYGVYPTTVVYSETDWVKNETFWSAGLRIYPMPSSDRITPFIDVQYGGLRVEAAQVITGIYEYSYVYSHEQKILWGPSLLAGLELRFGRFALSGGVGASYSLTYWDILESRVFFAFEAGLGIRL